MKSVLVWALLILPAGVLAAATGYYQHNLVSDQAGQADFTDPNLVNAWGLVTTATSPFWVCDGTGLSTVYAASDTPGSALGTPNASVKPTVPGAGGAPNGPCTGIVTNTASTSFMISEAGGTPHGASFIFATEDGTLSGLVERRRFGPRGLPSLITPPRRSIKDWRFRQRRLCCCTRRTSRAARSTCSMTALSRYR